MADQNEQRDAPVKESDPQGVRFPEDELADLEKKAGEAQAVEEAPKDEKPDANDEDASVAKLQEFMVKKGIKDIGVLVDMARDLESKNTRLSQDVQRLSAVTQYPAAQMPGRQIPPGGDDDIELPENPIELVTDKNKLRQFVKMLDDRARANVQKVRYSEQVQDIQAQVDRKRAEDPEKFDRLRGTMFELAGKNPAATIDQIMQMAEKAEVDKEAALVERVKKSLGLDTMDTAKLKSIVSRARTAPVSSGTGKQVDMKPDTKKEHEELLTAIANADKF